MKIGGRKKPRSYLIPQLHDSKLRLMTSKSTNGGVFISPSNSSQAYSRRKIVSSLLHRFLFFRQIIELQRKSESFCRSGTANFTSCVPESYLKEPNKFLERIPHTNLQIILHVSWLAICILNMQLRYFPPTIL